MVRRHRRRFAFKVHRFPARKNGLVQEPVGNAQPNTTAKHRKTAQECRQTPLQVAIVSQPIPTPKQQFEPNTGEADKTPLWKKIIEVLAIVLAVIVAVIYGGQLWVMKRQLIEMQHSTKASRDASYVACLSAQIAGQTLIELQRGANDNRTTAAASALQAIVAVQSNAAYISASTIDATPTEGQQLHGTLIIKNEGKSAATDLHIKARSVLVARDLEFNQFVYPKKESVELITPHLEAGQEPDATKGGITIRVRDKAGVPVIASYAQMVDIMQGRKDLLVFARLRYKDTLGENHWETFCRSYGTKTQSFGTAHQKCIRYNKGGGDLPIPKSAHIQQLSPNGATIVCQKPPDI